MSPLDCKLCDLIQSLDVKYNLGAPGVASAAPTSPVSPNCLSHLSTRMPHRWLQKQQGLSLIPTLHQGHDFPTWVPGPLTLVPGFTVYPWLNALPIYNPSGNLQIRLPKRLSNQDITPSSQRPSCSEPPPSHLHDLLHLTANKARVDFEIHKSEHPHPATALHSLPTGWRI